MKIKDGFILRVVAGTNLVAAVGERSKEYNRMIKLNDTGAFLWKLMERECTVAQLVDRLTQEYKVTREVAEYDVDAFVTALKGAGVLD
ncbi:MAG: PqqD family protein [Clostridia bacterium]|nr:PqqD family protein [Clostridia bacterium]